MAFLAVLFAGIYLEAARAEYGDVVINEFSDEAGMRPVVFPHWFHRIRFRCKVCHGDLGFKFEAGGNRINMLKIMLAKYFGNSFIYIPIISNNINIIIVWMTI